jgi:CheY-like chemotaxis protein
MPEPEIDLAGEDKPVKILVVEDEPLIRFFVSEALRDLGVSVVEAGTADEAWAYLQSGAPVDLVFTDHRMPGSMTGARLAAKIAQRFPALRIVLTSALVDEPEWPEKVLSKPYDLLATAGRLKALALATRQGGDVA